MKLTNATVGFVLAGFVAASVPAFAQDPATDPVLAAGKKIFEETAGDVGCAACHGMMGKGDSGPDIRGQTAENIKIQIEVNEDMGFIELTDEELDQVVAYLKYLDTL
jgi:mono/diheme cytochrome c family protein